MKAATFLFIFVLTAFKLTESAKILAVFPFLGKSHNYFLRSITDNLATRGHDVTIYTVFPSEKSIKNIKEIPLQNKLGDLIKRFSFEEFRKMGEIPVFNLPFFLFFGLQLSDVCLNDPVLTKLINSDEKFDAVILETHFGQEPFVALGHRFQAPVISINPFTTFYSIDEYIGNPLGVAYLPTFEVPYTDNMNFLERTHNALRTFIFATFNYLYYLPKQDAFVRKYFNYPGSENIPSIRKMLQDVSLVIVNSQFSVDYARPWVPNVVPAGGAHISPDRKPLPKDLQEFLDSAKQGFVYFSFGSVVPSEQMPDELKQALVNAFRKIPQKVLWKLPVDSFPGLPENVKISKWLPQHDVLAHPNCVAFITHGGLLSQEEAVYFGVPLIGVPFFADQHLNINRAVARGFAIHLSQHNITEQSVSWAVNEVINNKSYRENIMKYSNIFKDNLVTPLNNSAYWIEYVIRHKGAPHLRSEGRNLPYYKYLLLDVIAFMVLTLSLISYITYKLLSILCCKLFCKQSKSKKITSNKKKN